MPRPVVPMRSSSCLLLFTDTIDQLVVRHDEMGIVADEQASFHVDAVRLQHLDLFHERFRIDHRAVADDAGLLRPDDADWNEMQDVLLVSHLDGMPGIGAALEPHDDISLFTQEIDDLALAFVPPSCAYENANGHMTLQAPCLMPGQSFQHCDEDQKPGPKTTKRASHKTRPQDQRSYKVMIWEGSVRSSENDR